MHTTLRKHTQISTTELFQKLKNLGYIYLYKSVSYLKRIKCLRVKKITFVSVSCTTSHITSTNMKSNKKC